MSGEEGDTLMYFVQEKGADAMAAESTSALTDGDRTTLDFKPGQYFEVESFTFGMDLSDKEGDDDNGDSRSYARWRALKPDEPKPDQPFKAEPQDVSVTRRIDACSPLLMQYCLDTKAFDKAVIVKRAQGVGAQAQMRGFMRMEFSDVRLRAVEWQDGDVIREVCKFKFAAVKVTYRQRRQDNTLGAPWSCEWDSRNG